MSDSNDTPRGGDGRRDNESAPRPAQRWTAWVIGIVLLFILAVCAVLFFRSRPAAPTPQETQQQWDAQQEGQGTYAPEDVVLPGSDTVQGGAWEQDRAIDRF